MNIQLVLLSLSFASQVGADCVIPKKYSEALPSGLIQDGDGIPGFETDEDDLYLVCPNMQWFLIQSSGTVIFSADYIKCINDKLVTDSGIIFESLDEFLCTTGKLEDSCKINFMGSFLYMVQASSAECQSEQRAVIKVDGAEIAYGKTGILTCVKTGTVSVDGEDYSYGNSVDQLPRIDCIDETTTSTTTTVKPTTAADQELSDDVLWTLQFYYNYGRILHAFCSNSGCYNAIMKNGIGYEPTKGSYPLGKLVKNEAPAVARAKELCPTGFSAMKLLGFSRSGDAYVHNLNGQGLVMGYAPATSVCGFKIALKKYACRKSKDIMYSEDLEWNTYYKGMVQDGGKIQFYLK